MATRSQGFDFSGNQPGLDWVNRLLWEKCAEVQDAPELVTHTQQWDWAVVSCQTRIFNRFFNSYHLSLAPDLQDGAVNTGDSRSRCSNSAVLMSLMHLDSGWCDEQALTPIPWWPPACGLISGRRRRYARRWQKLTSQRRTRRASYCCRWACVSPNASMTTVRPGSTDESGHRQLRSPQTIRRSDMDPTVHRKSSRSL